MYTFIGDTAQNRVVLIMNILHNHILGSQKWIIFCHEKVSGMLVEIRIAFF